MKSDEEKYRFEFKIVPLHAKDRRLDEEIFRKTKDHDERVFNCELVKPTKIEEAAKAEYLLFTPQKLLLIQFVKFVPGKGYNDFLNYYRGEFEDRCRAMWGTDRHGLGIHEILTFFTLGEYDLIILLEAKDLEAYSKFVALHNGPNNSSSTSTQTVTLMGSHPG